MAIHEHLRERARRLAVEIEQHPWTGVAGGGDFDPGCVVCGQPAHAEVHVRAGAQMRFEDDFSGSREETIAEERRRLAHERQVRLQVKVPWRFKAEVERRAITEGTTMSAIVREALQRFLG